MAMMPKEMVMARIIIVSLAVIGLSGSLLSLKTATLEISLRNE